MNSTGSNQYVVPDTMKAWVLGGPDELSLIEKPVPQGDTPGERYSPTQPFSVGMPSLEGGRFPVG